MPAGLTRRISDTDREAVVGVLRENVTRGVLSLEELEERVAMVYQARTVADLGAVTWDLHFPSPPPARRSVWSKADFRIHAAAYGMTNGFLLGTWALTGHGFFWPFFPAAGWGIALGIHGLVRSHHHTPRPAPALVTGSPGTHRALAASSPLTTVQYVAVFFADIANSTGLSEAMGDSDWAKVRAAHLELLRSSLANHNGTEVSCQGDGIFARFDSPAAAVDCAIDIQRRIDDHKATAGFAPHVRIGVHAGEAVAEGTDLVGTAVNIAARVTAEAAPDEILVTEAVADRLSSDYTVDDRGVRVLKGVSRGRHLLRVRW